MKDRLQFIHHNEVFPTREAAIKYVKDLQIDSRPSLFAEPIVLKYESGDEEKGPNVILAIGSHGIGVYNEEYKRTLNRTFFIDITSEQEKIDDLYDKLEKAIKSLTLIPLESDTIKTFVEKTEEGTIISGDVKTAESMIFSGIEKTNTIEVVDGEGLYHYVDLIYTDDGVLKFQVNDVIKDYSIPVVTEGEYIYEGDDAETIVLTMNDGSTVKIPVGKLINEWTVMPEDANNTPIVLKREEVSAETCPHGVEVWQDLLSADIRLHEGDDNIIFKADGGKTLFATVGLDYNEIENKLVFKWSENGSVNTKDILLNSVKIIEYIKYDAATEEIVIGYKTSQASEIIEVRIPVGGLITEWQVVDAGHNVILRRERSVSGADIVYADVRIATNDIAPNNIIETVGDNHALYVRGEADNIKFDDSNVDAELKRLNSEEVRIEGKIDDEIERATVSENVLTDKIGTGFTTDPHENVTFKFGKLNDTLNETISDLNDEINNREDADDELAANIAAETTRATEAENAIATDLSVEVNRAKAAENGLNEAIDAEVTRAENAENVLTNKIGSGFTADPHENVTAKFNELSDDLIETTNDLTSEIARAQAAENALDVRVTATEAGLIEANEKIDETSGIAIAKLSSIAPADTSINVNTTDPINPTVGVKLNVNDENIIELREGVYATVDLTYNELANKLTFTTTNGSKEIQLVSVSVIKSITYDSQTESLIIVYTVNGQDKTIIVPVGDLIDEWEPYNNGHTVALVKARIPGRDKDQLSADVKISTDVDNILEIDNGEYLKVSNSGITEEAARAIAAETVLTNKIGTGFTDDVHANVTAKFNELSDDLTTTKNNLTNEIARAQVAENDIASDLSDEVANRIAGDNALSGAVSNEIARSLEADQTLTDKIGTGFTTDQNVTAKFEGLDTKVTGIDARVSANTEDIVTINGKINEISGTTAGKVSSVTAKDASVIVDNTDANNPEVQVNLKPLDSNIIELDNGIYATVDLSYDELANKLTFTTTNGSKEISLLSISIIDRIWYDATNKEIVIEYKVHDETLILRVPTQGLINEIVPDNHHHTVTLTKETVSGSGEDKLSADLNISNDPDNMIEIVGGVGGEYIKVSNASITAISADIASEVARATAAEGELSDKIGTGFTAANNITKKIEEIEAEIAQGGGSVDAEVARAMAAEANLQAQITAETTERASADTALNNAIVAEANRAEGVEDTINATIGTGFTTNQNVTAKFNKLESDLNNTTSGLTDEVTRATGVEADLQAQITAEVTERTSGYAELNNAVVAEASRADGVESTINATIGTGFTDNPYGNVTFKFDTLTNKVNGIDARVSGNTDDIATVTQKINELSAETANDIASVAAKDRSIVVDNTDAKNPKVGVALRNAEDNIVSIGEGVYVKVDLTYDSLANRLTFTTTNGSKEISLTSISVIDRIWYDSTNEEIVIEYKVGGETEVIRVPVRDMIDEWDIYNEGHSVLMTRVKSVSGTDIVYSDVKISDDADNILTKNNSGYLKVSNAPITLLDTAIQNEVARATNAEGAIDTKVDTVSGQVVNNASNIAALSGEVSANITKINTISGNVENLATGLTNEATTRESQIGALTQSALTLSSNTMVISGDVENIKTQYATDVTKLKNDVGSLSGDVITISTGLTVLDDKVDNIFSNLNVSEDSDIVNHSIILTKVTDGDTVKVRGDVRLHPNHDTFVNLLKQNPDDGTLYVSKADVTAVSLHPENNALFLTEEGIGLKLNGISETINSDNNVKFKVINNGGVKEIKCDVELFECGDY